MRVADPIWPRSAAVLIWLPVMLAAPLLDAAGARSALAGYALVLLVAAASVIGVLKSWPAPTGWSIAAWAVAFAGTLAGSLTWDGWKPVWLLVAMVGALAVPGRAVWASVSLTAVVSGAVALRFGVSIEEALTRAFVAALTGTTAAVLNRLLVTNRLLRQTREQLAQAAVAQERERVARDLHDVLGHTLSVIVVKAAAVRRLLASDPAAAAEHAADIENVGRTALTRVREVVMDAAPPTLTDELATAVEALHAAGITVTAPDPMPDDARGEPLAWALREAVTNVLRHSGAEHCRIRLDRADDTVTLTVSDDGIGPAGSRAEGGLAGLRRRLQAAGGGLDVRAGGDGFTVIAWVPHG